MDSVRNLLIALAFDGSNYHGFQVQKNAVSVCEVFQDAAESVLGTRYDVKGCSRTDSGVHARMYCLSMKIREQIPCDKLLLALNRSLPDDIAVTSVSVAADDFHARYSSKGKQYVYQVYNSVIKDPFLTNLAYRYGYPLDEDTLNRQAEEFVGTHDFAAFCSSKSDAPDTVRTVTEFSVTRNDKMVLFTVSADGFLYNMVRIMVGTLMFIAMGKLKGGCIPGIMASRNRANAGKTMPPHGLYLNKVFY